MTSLIERIESAEGPSYALDCAIGEYVAKTTGTPYIVPPRSYTASIDAALTLVPDGYQYGFATIPSADILRAGNHHAQAYVDGSEMVDFAKYFRAEAATPALALCAAALRARGEPA